MLLGVFFPFIFGEGVAIDVPCCRGLVALVVPWYVDGMLRIFQFMSVESHKITLYDPDLNVVGQEIIECSPTTWNA